MAMKMTLRPALAEHLALIAEPARFAMLSLLMDDRARPAGELARGAGVSMPTASSHLHKLLAAGFLRVHAQGRHRYYRMARADVARAVEALAQLAPSTEALERPETPLGRARTCFDHLAGALGVRLTEALVNRGWIALGRKAYRVLPAGRRGLAELGIVAASFAERGPQLARPCIDCTERRPHLGGALGAALARRLFELGWIARGRTPRVVRVTARGLAEISRTFGVSV